MAETILAGITIPDVLQGAVLSLRAAYGTHRYLQIRREQTRVLLDRNCKLILQITQYLEAYPEAANDINDGFQHIENACTSVKELLENISEKGFFWCLVNADIIDRRIKSSEGRVEHTFHVLFLFAQFDRTKFQDEMRRARESDQNDLSQLLMRLSNNNDRILDAIRDQDGMHRTFDELTVAIIKHLQHLPTGADLRPENNFLRLAVSGKRYLIPDFVLSNVEIDIDLRTKLGSGSYGEVYKGDWNGAAVAIKRMRDEDARMMSDEQRKGLYHEVKIWSKLNHPNILRLFGACLDAATPFIVMEYCPLGDVRHFLQIHPNADRIKLAYEVAIGLAFLHSKKIIHADVKGANVIVNQQHSAMLTDFGLSLKLIEIRTMSSYAQKLDRPRGTLPWMAPEVLEGASPDTKADVYSLGITIWEIVGGQVPFPTVLNSAVLIYQVTCKQIRPQRLEAFDDRIWGVLSRCWAADRDSRPEAKEVQDDMRLLGQPVKNIAEYRDEAQRMVSKEVNIPWDHFVNEYDTVQFVTSSDPHDNRHIQVVREFPSVTSVSQDKTNDVIDPYKDILPYVVDLSTCAYTSGAFSELLGRIQAAIDRLNLEGYADLEYWVAQLDQKIESILLQRLIHIIQVWCARFDRSDEDRRRDPPVLRGVTNKRRGDERPKDEKLLEGTITIKRTVHKIRIQNEVIFLDPPVEYARQTWIRQLHERLGIVCNLRRIQSSRYEIGLQMQSSIVVETTYTTSLLIRCPHATLGRPFALIENKVQQLKEYAATWLRFQSLWDMEDKYLFNQVGKDFTHWQQLCKEIWKMRSTLDTSECQKSFGAGIINYKQVRAPVKAKYDDWQSRFIKKFRSKQMEQLISKCNAKS